MQVGRAAPGVLKHGASPPWNDRLRGLRGGAGSPLGSSLLSHVSPLGCASLFARMIADWPGGRPALPRFQTGRQAMQKTLVLLKPDAVHRHLIGAILHRFEQKGLRIVAMKIMHASKELAQKHYAVHKDK